MIKQEVLSAAKSIGQTMAVRQLSPDELSNMVSDQCEAFAVVGEEETVSQLAKWLGGILWAREDAVRPLTQAVEDLGNSISSPSKRPQNS